MSVFLEAFEYELCIVLVFRAVSAIVAVLILGLVIYAVVEIYKYRPTPCAHKWEILVDKILESPYDATVNAGSALRSVDHIDLEDGRWFFERKSITILKCACGKIHETIV